MMLKSKYGIIITLARYVDDVSLQRLHSDIDEAIAYDLSTAVDETSTAYLDFSGLTPTDDTQVAILLDAVKCKLRLLLHRSYLGRRVSRIVLLNYDLGNTDLSLIGRLTERLGSEGVVPNVPVFDSTGRLFSICNFNIRNLQPREVTAFNALLELDAEDCGRWFTSKDVRQVLQEAGLDCCDLSVGLSSLADKIPETLHQRRVVSDKRRSTHNVYRFNNSREVRQYETQ